MGPALGVACWCSGGVSWYHYYLCLMINTREWGCWSVNPFFFFLSTRCQASRWAAYVKIKQPATPFILFCFLTRARRWCQNQRESTQRRASSPFLFMIMMLLLVDFKDCMSISFEVEHKKKKRNKRNAFLAVMDRMRSENSRKDFYHLNWNLKVLCVDSPCLQR